MINLRKRYANITAVDDVSFTVNRGEIVGLLGPNGAGKTTTINMVLGVLEPTGGRVIIDEIDIAKNRAMALKRANFAAVYASLPGNLTVSENLRFFGLLYSIRGLRARVDELLEEFDLVRLRDTKCGLLSSGEQTRAALAKAVLNKPQLLLLDEPTASLDPSAAQIIRGTNQVPGGARSLRNPVDLAQHVRGRGGLRSGAVSVARQAAARGESENASRRARVFEPGGSVHPRGTRTVEPQLGAEP